MFNFLLPKSPNFESFNLPPKSPNSGGLAIFIYSLIAFCSLLTAFDTVYGRIPAQQTSTKVGNYSDTITITISF